MAGWTVVTGGSRGIGAAVVRRLAASGRDVVVGYRRDREAAEARARDARAADVHAAVLQVDVADPASVDALFDEAESFGPVVGVVANAGAATVTGRLEDVPVEAVRRDLDVLVLGTLLTLRRGVPALRRAGGGAMVAISSGAATLGSPGEFVHYAAAKAAVDTMVLGLGRELAEDGIRVNAVAPGLVETGFHLDPDRPARIAPTVPMRRVGEPHEIAAAVAWLLSADASYTTATTLRVAGGR
ncbi:SDR family NAD(P)-dependent oxidoreductase [Amnibacterium endophyticum]|uniref:SDR family NAD(P)-dependent oxidoreductase n=1 Tax=Amnibacterium endophyticum TaxID=2109337 RepID=A0ABW4LF77_9MICO